MTTNYGDIKSIAEKHGWLPEFAVDTTDERGMIYHHPAHLGHRLKVTHASSYSTATQWVHTGADAEPIGSSAGMKSLEDLETHLNWLHGIETN